MLQVHKEVEKVSKLITTKLAGLNVSIDVELLIDVSGSTRDDFRQGRMEEIFQRVMAFANRVDPNKRVDVTAFSSNTVHCGEFDTSDFQGFMPKFMRAADSVLWDGTVYSKAFESIQKSRGEKIIKSVGGMFKSLFSSSEISKPMQKTRLVIFITDGEDYGRAVEFYKAVEANLADKSTFILAIGVGKESHFSILEDADDKFHGFSFVFAKDYSKLNDDSFYDLLLSAEFVQWYKENGVSK